MAEHAIDELVPDVVRAAGALDFDQRPQGLSPRRLPDWTRMQVPQVMDVMVRMPSGVRLEFATDSASVGLGFLATNMVTPPAERRPIAFNCEVDGVLLGAESTAGNHILLDPDDPTRFELVRGDADVVRFELPGDGMRQVAIWLPHNAFIELRTLEIDDGATLEAPAAESRPRWLHYGSSISHCMEADEPAGTWPAVAARTAGVALNSFGFGGQCHLDQFLARTLRGLDADVISLKTGINIINADSMRERVFVPALHGFLDTIREAKPTTPIMLISPIFCPAAEDSPGPTLRGPDGKFVTRERDPELIVGCMSLKRVRRLIEDVVAARQEAGDANLYYLSGLELFGADDAGDLPDDLHPNPGGYRRMGKRFAPHLARLLDNA